MTVATVFQLHVRAYSHLLFKYFSTPDLFQLSFQTYFLTIVSFLSNLYFLLAVGISRISRVFFLSEDFAYRLD